MLHHAPATALLTRRASVALLAGRSHTTRGALPGDALSLLKFGGSASSPSSAAEIVEMQLVLRCGQRPGVCGRRCRQLPAHTCKPLTAALCLICCCTAPWARPPPPSPSAAQSPPPSSPPPALFLDDSVQLSAAAAAAGRCQAARSYSRRPPKWLRRRSSAPCAVAIFGRLRRVARALSGGSGGAARLACSPGGLRRVYVKKCWLHSAFSRVVRLPERMSCVSLMPLTLLYKRVCVV